MDAPTPRLLPELLALIGQYLTPSDLATCVRVSRDWNEMFIPILWNTVDDSHLVRLCLCPQPFRSPGTPCPEEADLCALLTKYGLHIRHLTITYGLIVSICAKSSSVCNLVSLNVRDGLPHLPHNLLQSHGKTKDIFEKAIRRYGYLFPSGHLGNVLLHTPSVHRPADMIESPKPIFSMLGTPDDWLTAEERYFFLQPHHLRHLVNLNSRNLQKLHFGENSWVFHHVLAPESFYSLLAPLTSLTDFQLPGRGVSLVTLKYVLPRLQYVCFTLSNFAVGTLFRDGGLREPWQLLYDVQYPSLQGQNSNIRALPIKSLEIGRTTSFTELCRIIKQFPAIERLGIVGIHDHQVEMTEPLQNLAKAHQDLFRGIKELRIYGVFIPLAFLQRDIMALLSYLPNLQALTIPLRLENNIAKLLAKLCPYLKTIRTDDYVWPHHPHPATLCSAALLLTSYTDLRVVDLVLNQIHVNQLNYDQPWTCLGLEILRCQIAGIEHLDKFEQQRYDVLVQEGRHQLGNTGQRTSYEDQIVELMQRSRRKHKLVYWQLSQLSKLRILDLGFSDPRLTGPVVQWGQTPTAPITLPNSLELSLESGLDQLRSLKKLEVFGMESMNHRMGKAELKWMVHHWPRLEQMHGLHADKSQEPEHEAIKTELRKYLQSLKPSIVHASQPVKQLKLQGSEVSLAFLLHTAVTPH
ncbi:hypothetical protein BGZ74_010937 [Mortierella antarctica]|nr:hypothetical protein BGZ74_010937 [Mortierella antarctica]